MAAKRKRLPKEGFFDPAIREVEEGSGILDHVAEIALADHNRLKKTNFVLVEIEKAMKEEVCGLLWYLTLKVKDRTTKTKTIRKVAWQGTSYQVSVIGKDVSEDYLVDGLEELVLLEADKQALADMAMKKCMSIESGYTLKKYILKSHGCKDEKHGAGYNKFIMSRLYLEANETDVSWDVIMVHREWLRTLDDTKAQSFFGKIEISLSRPPPTPIPRDRPCAPHYITYDFDLSNTDLDSAHIETIACFALDNHNFIKNQQLELVKVMSGFFNACYGNTVFLTLRVRDKGKLKTCTTKVWGKPRKDVWSPLLLTDAKPRKDQYLSWELFRRKIEGVWG